MEEKTWKIYKDEFIDASKKFGKSLIKFIWKTSVFIGMSVWIGFTWIANFRLKIPRVSFLVEFFILIIPAIYYYAEYVKERVLEGARSYRVNLQHEQELIKEEFSGYERGKKFILDSIERERIKAESIRVQREAQWRIKAAIEAKQKKEQEEKSLKPEELK